MDTGGHSVKRSSRDRAPARSRRVSAGAVLLGAVIAAIFVGSAWLRERIARTAAGRAAAPAECRRIVSMAPSVTEILFQLGLGDRVVGVSRFCDYPPDARGLPRVGGLFDPNLEAIVMLRPDLVILPTPEAGTVEGFDKLGLACLELDHRGPDGIFDSISAVGRACGVEEDAAALAGRMRERLRRVTQKTSGLARPRVLLAVDHSAGGTQIEDVYVAGSSRYFNPILDWAGGKNVFGDVDEAFPVVSREAILKVNPEVIVDLVSTDRLPRGGAGAVRDGWREIEQIDAVTADRIYIVTADYATVPGPRFILLVEHLARLLHPEVEWDP
ncbi:MAG: ABC transporter substrate-binding protein [Pirellulales bacterium]|nr:ABC transporter substrate-binding protein [Pirellulales bacterium]